MMMRDRKRNYERDYEWDDDDEPEPYVVVEQQGSSLGPFLLGLAAGAVTALLLAPQTGPETRRLLNARARDARDLAKRTIDDAVSRVTGTVHEARAEVDEQIRKARTAVRRGKHQVEDAIDAGKSAAHDARRELEQKLSEKLPETKASDKPQS